MQLNNQLQLNAILKEQKRQRRDRLSQERQVRLISLIMMLTAVFGLHTLSKIVF